MDLKSIAESFAKFGLPLLGAALPVPGGAAIGAALASMIGSPSGKPEDILATLAQGAEKVQAAKQFEITNNTHLMQMAYDYEIEMRKADSADVAAVNTTMQAEVTNSANETWYQKGWRPANGFVVALGSLFATVAVCWLFYVSIKTNNANALAAIPGVTFAVASILAVPGAAVGITAWHRGKLQIAQATLAAQQP